MDDGAVHRHARGAARARLGADPRPADAQLLPSPDCRVQAVAVGVGAQLYTGAGGPAVVGGQFVRGGMGGLFELGLLTACSRSECLTGLLPEDPRPRTESSIADGAKPG